MKFSNQQLEKQQNQYAEDAKDYIDRPKKTNSLTLFVDMIRAYQSGEYRNIRRTTILKVIGALIYLVSPIDLVPDFVLGFGFADDIAVILFVTKTVFEELTRFSDWQDEQQKRRTQPVQSEDAY